MVPSSSLYYFVSATPVIAAGRLTCSILALQRHVEEHLPEGICERCHFFNSFFFKKLTEKGPDRKSGGSSGSGGGPFGSPGKDSAYKRGFERVRKWTRVSFPPGIECPMFRDDKPKRQLDELNQPQLHDCPFDTLPHRSRSLAAILEQHILNNQVGSMYWLPMTACSC